MDVNECIEVNFATKKDFDEGRTEENLIFCVEERDFYPESI